MNCDDMENAFSPMERSCTEALDSSNVASLRERSLIRTLFRAGKSDDDEKVESILVKTSFGRVAKESFPMENNSTFSRPLIWMLVSFWKDFSPNAT